jgi:arginase family enzyme
MVTNLAFGTIIISLGVVTMFLGALLALFSVNLKRTLACSSMSQIGFILVGIGSSVLARSLFEDGGEAFVLAYSGTMLHMVNHSLLKLVLFMCAGTVVMNIHALDLNAIRGYGRNKLPLKIPFLLGGEHLVTLGAVRAAAKRHPNLVVIHFDAHADLREDYLGVQLSHACVIRRCHDILGDGRIFQFGIRSGTRDERQFMRDGHVTTELFSDSTLADVIEKIGSEVPVYLTVDMDVLDPSEFPGTGTQEAGGLTYTQLVSDVRFVCSKLNVVALDNVELSPSLDPSGRSTALACKFLREELLSL